MTESTRPGKIEILGVYLRDTSGIAWSLIVAALAVTLGVAVCYDLSRHATVALLCHLLGSALLAASMEAQADRPMDNQSRFEWFFDRSYAHFVGFNKPEFFLGLISLAIGAILGVTESVK
jgi:hypothetical protein